jgi:hypothetical protein
LPKEGKVPKATIVNSVEGRVTSAVSFDIDLRGFPANTLVCYDRLVATDHTSSATNVIIGLKSGVTEVLLGSGAQAALGGTLSVEGKIFAPGHWAPFARFKGASLNDRVALFVFGYVTDNPE